MPGFAAMAATFDSIDAFLDSTTWLVTRNLALLLVVFFWLAVAWWAVRDARRHVDDPWLVAVAGVVVARLPYLGRSSTCCCAPPS